MNLVGLGLDDDNLKQREENLKKLVNLSIEKQCKQLKIPLDKIIVNSLENPEIVAKTNLINDEKYKHVYLMENKFNKLFHMMFFDFIYYKAKEEAGVYHSWDFYDYLFNDRYKDKLLKEVKKMNSKTLKKNCKLMNRITSTEYKDNYDYELNDNISFYTDDIEKYIKIFSGIKKDNLIKATKIYLMENSFYSGWPDLIAIKSKEKNATNEYQTRFLEVKTTDNLMLNQLFIFSCFRGKSNLDMRVIKLEKSK